MIRVAKRLDIFKGLRLRKRSQFINLIFNFIELALELDDSCVITPSRLFTRNLTEQRDLLLNIIQALVDTGN